MRLLLDIVICILVYLIFFLPKWKRNKIQFVSNTLFYIYCCGLLFATIFPFPLIWNFKSFDPQMANLQPFRDLIYGYGGAEKDLVLNVLMTIPLGILYPMTTHHGIFRTTLASFLTSLSIESIQLLMQLLGSDAHFFDVTDVINNTVGAIVGFLIYSIRKTIFKQKKTIRK